MGEGAGGHCDWDKGSGSEGTSSEYRHILYKAMYCTEAPVPFGFMTLPQLERFVESTNAIQGCKIPSCKGALVPVAVKSNGLGGAHFCWLYMSGGGQPSFGEADVLW